MQESSRIIRLYRRVYSHSTLPLALSVLGSISVILVILGFVSLTVSLLIGEKYTECAKLVIVTGVPFAIVSVMRKIIDCPRPYEVFDLEAFHKMKEKRKSGSSFPSRHVFSAFVIGIILLNYSWMLGTLVLLLGAFIGTQRVLLGIHFLRDAIAGAVIGIASGIVGILIL